MTTFKIIEVEETNQNADPTKANNGGGYSHPRITFEYKGIQGVYGALLCSFTLGVLVSQKDLLKKLF
ncbi:hypothetical protein [Staphylococcus delphini]|uniref:Uncharacterized protein n=1 Tax=Staphylococcus delphini TaxID=53344 RepID=A0AAX0QU88_9STAP|nr:hypothetical protein [Staphylococcus delphini]PCF50153.1 hypothetical protein B5C07_08065 [Staphylococcus delphini]PNZ95999.1 hypothetical protein CD148_02395 [Staphylococcus delphini]RIZ56215.1 hypothetical protein CDL68_01360 [Staphylococcus delphini]VED62441.1 Uncharacterised protein [Staphylococcus delphini]